MKVLSQECQEKLLDSFMSCGKILDCILVFLNFFIAIGIVFAGPCMIIAATVVSVKSIVDDPETFGYVLILAGSLFTFFMVSFFRCWTVETSSNTD